MAQCELVDPMAPGLSCVTHIRFRGDSHLPDGYFSLDRALFYFRQGIPDRAPSGLINVGYNCYMNAVTQCLAHTPGFQKFVSSMPNAMYENNKKDAFFLDCFAHIFALFKDKKSACPDWLISDCYLINDMYKMPVQQDAHEFLLNILQKFDKECRNAMRNSENEKADTMITNMFCGKFNVSISCDECGYQCSTSTRFTDINIPILKYNDAEEAVRDIFSHHSHEIDGKCEKCGKTNCLTTTKQMSRYPLVLILTLMRFDNSCKKLDEFFEFQKFLSLDKGRIKYQLYGMVVHEGRMINHGHFISYVMDAQDDWYKTDDVLVFKVKEEKVMSSCPYVLFYKRIDV